MTKQDLISTIASDVDITKKDAERVLIIFLDSIKNALKKGDKISLAGFGTFEVSNRKSRTGINPQTGEKIKIKASKIPKFKPSKNLKDAVK